MTLPEAIRQPLARTLEQTDTRHQTLTLTNDGQKLFIKMCAAEDLARFEAEVDGLTALRQIDSWYIPHVIWVGIIDKHAVLVLEHLQLQNISSRLDATAFANALITQHRITSTQFGWRRDNFIGTHPQKNTEHKNWAQFFASQRIAPQLELVITHHNDRSLIDKGEKLIETLSTFFVDEPPVPSLLHGDLWHGNAAITPDGKPSIFDPAVYFGDREADLAMTELFGGIPDTFYAAYREAWPLSKAYEQRKVLYNLYHMLNHFNLFGAGYQRQALRMMDKLLAELRG